MEFSNFSYTIAAIALLQFLNKDITSLFIWALSHILGWVGKVKVDGFFGSEGVMVYAPDSTESSRCRYIIEDIQVESFEVNVDKFLIRLTNVLGNGDSVSVFLNRDTKNKYMNLFDYLVKNHSEDKIIFRKWSRKVNAYDLADFLTTYPNPHLNINKTIPYPADIINGKAFSFLTSVHFIFEGSSWYKKEYAVFLNVFILFLYIFKFFVKDVLNDMLAKKLFLYKKTLLRKLNLNEARYCHPFTSCIEKQSKEENKFICFSWVGHSFYKGADRIYAPNILADRSNITKESFYTRIAKGKTTYLIQGEKGKASYDLEVLSEGSLCKVKLSFKNDHVVQEHTEYIRKDCLACLIKVLVYLEKGNSMPFISTFQWYKEIIHFKDVKDILKDLNKQDFTGFGLQIVSKKIDGYYVIAGKESILEEVIKNNSELIASSPDYNLAFLCLKNSVPKIKVKETMSRLFNSLMVHNMLVFGKLNTTPFIWAMEFERVRKKCPEMSNKKWKHYLSDVSHILVSFGIKRIKLSDNLPQTKNCAISLGTNINIGFPINNSSELEKIEVVVESGENTGCGTESLFKEFIDLEKNIINDRRDSIKIFKKVMKETNDIVRAFPKVKDQIVQSISKKKGLGHKLNSEEKKAEKMMSEPDFENYVEKDFLNCAKEITPFLKTYKEVLISQMGQMKDACSRKRELNKAHISPDIYKDDIDDQFKFPKKYSIVKMPTRYKTALSNKFSCLSAESFNLVCRITEKAFNLNSRKVEEKSREITKRMTDKEGSSKSLKKKIFLVQKESKNLKKRQTLQPVLTFSALQSIVKNKVVSVNKKHEFLDFKLSDIGIKKRWLKNRISVLKSLLIEVKGKKDKKVEKTSLYLAYSRLSLGLSIKTNEGFENLFNTFEPTLHTSHLFSLSSAVKKMFSVLKTFRQSEDRVIFSEFCESLRQVEALQSECMTCQTDCNLGLELPCDKDKVDEIINSIISYLKEKLTN